MGGASGKLGVTATGIDNHAKAQAEPAAAADDGAGEPDYSKMNKAELVAEAEEQGVESSGTKADIIAALEASAEVSA